MAPPINDNFASATEITGTSGTLTGQSNVDATFETGEPNPPAGNGQQTIWYKLLPTVGGEVVIDTFGSTQSSGSALDTVLSVYTGTAVNALTLVTWNDDSGGPRSKVTFTAQAGVAYYARIAGYNFGSTSPNIVINWTAPAAGAPAPPPAPPPEPVDVLPPPGPGLAAVCPNLIGLVDRAYGFIEYDDDRTTLVGSFGENFSTITFPGLVEGPLDSNTGGLNSWSMNAAGSIFRHSQYSASLLRFNRNPPDAGSFIINQPTSPNGITSGVNRPVTYDPVGNKLYVLVDGNPGAVGQRIARYAVDGTFEAIVHTFSEVYYDTQTDTASGLECFEGVLYGMLFGAGTSTKRYPFAFNIATGTAALGPSDYTTGFGGMLEVRGTHHDGCGVFRTGSDTYVRMYPDCSVDPLGCTDLDNSLGNVSYLTTHTRTGLNRTLYNVRYVKGGATEYRVYEGFSPLDVPTLALPSLMVPFRALETELGGLG